MASKKKIEDTVETIETVVDLVVSAGSVAAEVGKGVGSLVHGKEQVPTVGRVVHVFEEGDSKPRLGFISSVDGVNVEVLYFVNYLGCWKNRLVPQKNDELGSASTFWVWPPRV